MKSECLNCPHLKYDTKPISCELYGTLELESHEVTLEGQKYHTVIPAQTLLCGRGRPVAPKVQTRRR